jgi:group I intron endonuclease
MATYIQGTGVYQIVNKITQKRYIGKSSNIQSRWNGHKHDLINNKHPNNYLQKSWNKYGKLNFEFEILQICSLDQCSLYEDYWVKILKTENREFGYNLKPTDPTGKSGFSQETIEKIRKANKGRKPSYICLQKRKELGISNSLKEKMKQGRSTKEAKQKYRESRGVKIINILTGEQYISMSDVSEKSGIPVYELSRRLRGVRKNNTQYKILD